MQETERNFHAQYTFAVNYRCFHVNKKKRSHSTGILTQRGYFRALQ